MKPGEWIMVQGGWTPRQFADAPGGFTLAELDSVAPKLSAAIMPPATLRLLVPQSARAMPLAYSTFDITPQKPADRRHAQRDDDPTRYLH